MAGWVKLAVRSFVVAGLVGAAQLGAAQALALLVWSTVPTPDVWRRQLMWLLFIFAAAVLGGVAGGRRSVRAIRRAIANRRADAAAARHAGLVAHQSNLGAARRRALANARNKTVDTARGFAAGATRVSATVFAALGAAASFLLVWLPARNAFAAADLRVLAITAGVGITVGAIISLLSLAAAPIAANAGVSVAGVWLFGLTSVALAIGSGRTTQTPLLGVIDAPYLIGPDEWWLGPNLMVAVAAVFGVAVAATARWIGAHRLGIALSGLAGPAVVAAGYLLVGPAGELMSSYVAALLAATVGLLTSAATAAAHRAPPALAGPRTPAALTAGSAPAARPPLAIESGRAAQHQYPAAPQYPNALQYSGATQHAATQHSAGQYTPSTPYPAATAYPTPAYPAASAYPTANQYPAAASYVDKRGRPRPGHATPPAGAAEPQFGSAEPLYVAPPRSAPVPRARPATPPQRPTPPAPRPAPAPPPSPAPAAAPLAPPVAAPASPRAKLPPSPVPEPFTGPPERPAAARGKPPHPPAPKPAPPNPVPPMPSPGKPAPAAAATATAEPASPTPGPAPKSAGRKSHRGRADRTVRVPPPVVPQPASDEVDIPRTTRPAEVVAVEPTRPATDAKQPRPKGRRARKRAERLAAELAEAQERRRLQQERGDATPLKKGEKEHVDWVKHLVSLPNDPTLTTRQK